MAGYAADPVNTALGNFVEVETDLPFGGLLAGLTFARTYNSRSDRSGPFGARWASWATTRLVERTWTAEFEGPDGQRVAFPRTGSGFGRAVGVDALVERSAAGLALAWFDGRRWEFDAAGRPVRTWAGPGTAVRFVHDGRPAGRAGPRARSHRDRGVGRRGRVVAVSGSDGRRVDYRYADGGLVEAAGPAGARRYDLDEAGRVASVTDADGVVELVNTYDEQGRVLTQRSPFGRLVTFGYAAGRVDGGRRRLGRSDERLPARRRRPAGRPHRRPRPHAAQTLRRLGQPGRDRRARRRGDPAGVRRPRAPGAPHDAVRSGVHGGLGRRRPGGRDHGRRRADPVRTLRGRRAHPVGDRRPGGRGHPPARGRRAGAGRHGPRRRHGPAAPRLRRPPRRGRRRRRRCGADRARRRRARRARWSPRPGGAPSWSTTGTGGWSSAATRPAACGATSTAPRAGGPRWSIRPGRARRPPTVRTARPRSSSTRSARSPPRATTCSATSPTAPTPDGAKWAFRHDALSRLTAWTDPAGGTWWQEHDVDGNPTGSADPTGVRTRITYDQAGRVTAVDDGLIVTGTELRRTGPARRRACDTARVGSVTPTAPPHAGLRPVRAA